ncbi:ATP synthase I chain [Desulfovibrio sp. X2]|uniref:ATP synthase subunit I n=1 Tax=Desulfovibrio sp. X2 TaxID=941449 RepID=UPI000358C7E5|nr:ATP synthase subunit I [Desulfovibrio sp. X2]EPR40845.1 ATP synthase I chain [Desulfovibrio sp. X2]
MIQSIRHHVESALYKRGFRQADVRRLVAMQILLAAVLSLLFAVTGMWGLAFAAGALIVTVNFYCLAGFAQVAVKVRQGAVGAQIMRFYLRLGLTGVALYGLIVWLRVPLSGLLAGLTTVVATALVWGATRVAGQKVKEA